MPWLALEVLHCVCSCCLSHQLENIALGLPWPVSLGRSNSMNLLEGWLYYCILLYPVFFSIPNGQTSPSRERIYSAVNWGRFTERGRFPNIPKYWGHSHPSTHKKYLTLLKHFFWSKPRVTVTRDAVFVFQSFGIPGFFQVVPTFIDQNHPKSQILNNQVKLPRDHWYAHYFSVSRPKRSGTGQQKGHGLTWIVWIVVFVLLKRIWGSTVCRI